jgi:hypothetical protein
MRGASLCCRMRACARRMLSPQLTGGRERGRDLLESDLQSEKYLKPLTLRRAEVLSGDFAAALRSWLNSQ